MTPDPRSSGSERPGWRSRLRRPTGRQLRWALAALPVALVLYVLVLIPFTPGISDIRKAKSEQPAQVLSADGKLLAQFKRANRDWVPLDKISPNVVAALISTEDHRFYSHHGIDWRRTAGAALRTLSGDRQGGSTLTQQLARNLYPEEIGRAASLTRKIKEAITAFKIELVYSKDEILETYLNTVPFLYNATGIEMAARTYFDKPADRLDVLESATLVGMLKGTSYYNPVLNPERAVERRNIVLAQMVKRGRLDERRFQALKKRPLRVDFERQTPEEGPAPHFARQLRKWLIAWADRNDYNIYTDGLVVRTTIDSRLQAFANQAVARQGRRLQAIADAAWSPGGGWSSNGALVQAFLRETAAYRAAREAGVTDADALAQLRRDGQLMRELREQKTRIQAGFLALDPRSGEIRAWVGSRDFADDAFDHVQQARRQPGSTFKPFVYGAAFAQGMNPDDTLMDEAVEIRLAGGEVWRPGDGARPSGRPFTLRDALAYSKNTVTAQLVQKVGPVRVANLARAMGVRDSQLEPVPSLALGTSPVSLKEMVAAYGTIANGGAYLEPTMVTRIEDRDGNVLATFGTPSPQRAISAQAAYTLLDVMRDVVDRGTGASIRRVYGIRADVAGKTGTTQDNADGWFILMHPQLVAGAWVGFNDARVTLRSDYWGQGAHSALPIVGDVVQRALRARAIDASARFESPRQGHFYDPLVKPVEDWFARWFGPASAPEPDAGREPPPRARPAPEPAAPAPASDAQAAPEPVEPPADWPQPSVPASEATPQEYGWSASPASEPGVSPASGAAGVLPSTGGAASVPGSTASGAVPGMGMPAPVTNGGTGAVNGYGSTGGSPDPVVEPGAGAVGVP
ncbi:penicillin-binding protein 1A [Cupriavidus gilardii J11]|uniref:Penicillin-binding protein 1A n=1 Tax=Cupriavidus gilardii J11 TaxID=936133 RepID=A0A562BTF4_9BURK|nr:transglycosylase domain-containing protein [Cupriavidus gilardii]TWG88444.1 penicillin-binding protein 1A [Cupriavidus gilardii J11]